jgi:8-oxo-dGTP pyrophosphatase MutT (NUDIX family)
MQLSPIQNHIISCLKNADSLRYRDLRPEGTPNDLFNYHLKMLLSKQLVDKDESGYRLSGLGREYVADAYHTNDQANRLFKINVITVVSGMENGVCQILTQERHAQPSYGQVGVMGGTILKGEIFTDGACRKLQQETGLRADFRVIGIERRRLYKSNELFSDVLFPICYAGSYSGTLLETTEFGDNYWVDIDQAILNDTRPFDSIQAIPKVLKAIRDGTISELPFFCDETTQKDTI